MSRLSNKLQIALSPTAVGVIANGRRASSPLLSTDDHDQTHALIQAAKTLLTEVSAPSGPARAVFSHGLAPVWQCPAPPVRLNNAELTGWVQDQSIEKFGDSAADWDLAWDRPPPGTPIWVSGINRAVLLDLTTTLKEKGIALQSAEPWLSVAAVKYQKQLGEKNAWFALAEPGRITLAGFKKGEPHSLRSSPFDISAQNALTTLGNMLAREALLNPEFKAQHIWIRAFGLHAHWQELSQAHELEVHASLVPDLDVTEILEN